MGQTLDLPPLAVDWLTYRGMGIPQGSGAPLLGANDELGRNMGTVKNSMNWESR